VNTDETFLRAILANPSDTSLPLVYADWLEERGDPRGACIRQHPEAYGFLAQFQNARKYPFTVIENYAAEGRFGLLATLVAVLEGHRNHEPIRAVMSRLGDTTLHHIHQALALTSGNGSLDALLQAYAASPGQVSWGRELASRIADGQSPDVLLPLFDRPPQDPNVRELLACVLQELVLRGVHVGGVAQFAGHPLARLPLHLLEMESEVTRLLPNFGPRGHSRQCLLNLAASGAALLPTADHCYVAEASSVDSIGSVVRSWTAGSNGMCEAKVFKTEHKIGIESLSLSFLRSLHLDCLGVDIRADVVSASRAFALLFAAASGGGAYGGRLEGAYGRLAAWESMSGLCGATDGQSVESIAALAEQCTWVSFVCDSEWFYHAAWDFALLAIRPDGTSVAVLAVTDTD